MDVRGGSTRTASSSRYDFTHVRPGRHVDADRRTRAARDAVAEPPALGGPDRRPSGDATTIPNKRVLGEDAAALQGLPQERRRSRRRARPQTAFAAEQMIDELAYAAKIDPIAFRRQNIDRRTPETGG